MCNQLFSGCSAICHGVCFIRPAYLEEERTSADAHIGFAEQCDQSALGPPNGDLEMTLNPAHSSLAGVRLAAPVIPPHALSVMLSLASGRGFSWLSLQLPVMPLRSSPREFYSQSLGVLRRASSHGQSVPQRLLLFRGLNSPCVACAS